MQDQEKDSEQTEEVKKEDQALKKAKDQMYADLELVLEKKKPFKDISITYDAMLSKFSDSFKQEFLTENGAVFERYLTAWSAQTETYLSAQDFGDIKYTFKTIVPDEEYKEFTGYTGTISFTTKGKSKDLRISVYEIKNVFYVNYIHEGETVD
jgi:hypothetical protein